MFLHVLDDFGDFHTKSLFLVFNIWEAENPPFLVFIVSRVSKSQLIKGKYYVSFSSGERQREEDRRGKSHEAQKRGAHAARFLGHVGPTKWSLGHFLA